MQRREEWIEDAVGVVSDDGLLRLAFLQCPQSVLPFRLWGWGRCRIDTGGAFFSSTSIATRASSSDSSSRPESDPLP